MMFNGTWQAGEHTRLITGGAGTKVKTLCVPDSKYFSKFSDVCAKEESELKSKFVE